MSKLAVITGGARRIGKDIVINLVKQGYDILFTYNNSISEAADLIKLVNDQNNNKCYSFKCDLNKFEEVEALFNYIDDNFNNWQVLINNASIFNLSNFKSDFEKEFYPNFNIHLLAPLYLSNKFAKYIERRNITEANIINIIDKNITRYETKYFYYLLSKKFLYELTKMLSLELAPNIRVNAIAPGFILNSINETNPDKENKRLIDKIPLHTKGDTKDIADAIIFLLNSKFITGQTIFVDGGASLNHAG